MSTSRGDTIPDLEEQFSRPGSQRGCENGTPDTEIAPDSNDDEIWSTGPGVGEMKARWRTDGFSSLPFLRR
jgi:hypothetical protein